MSQAAPFKQILEQLFNLERLRRVLCFAILPGLLGYALLLTILTIFGFTFLEAIRDSVQQTDTSSWLGLVSNIGVLLMVSTAVICFFTVSIKPPATTAKQRECLLLTGMLSALLAFDDFFLLHDRYIKEEIVYLAYALFLLMLLYRHFARIMAINGTAFLVASGLLALSILTDVSDPLIPFSSQYVQAMEEGFKFVGMSVWLYFGYCMASFCLRPKSIR